MAIYTSNQLMIATEIINSLNAPLGHQTGPDSLRNVLRGKKRLYTETHPGLTAA